jgi:hypothetical protein
MKAIYIMTSKIIITSNETIVCPKCDHHFPLDQGITRQTIEGYEKEFDNAFAEQKKVLEVQLAKEAERKVTKQFSDQISKLNEQVIEQKKAAEEAKALIAKAQVEGKAKALQEFEQEKKMFAEELKDKDEKLRQFRDQELDLRKQKKTLEEAQGNLQLELQRQLDVERQKLVEEITLKESNHFAMIEAEYKKKIEDAQKSNEDLRRKLEQGSQQLQGEVQELELENMLRVKFPFDSIEPVPKGEFGGDVLQRVVSSTGQQCGAILWESKRTKNWSDGWLTKLREDQRTAKAEISVIVSQVLPKGVEAFDVIDGVWVASPLAALPVATVLRHTLLQVSMARQVSEGQQTKTELVYQYLTGPRFRHRIEAIVESFSGMKDDLDKERKAIMKQWAKREGQIERVMNATVGMYGDLQGIAGKSLQEIDGIGLLTLESDSKGEPDEKK